VTKLKIEQHIGIGILKHATLADYRHMSGVVIRMPCGFAFTLHSVPSQGFKKTIPCPCGDRKHILVRVDKA
jgi:hypothetical protein